MAHCYCSVPGCSNNKKNFPHLSFHDFPADAGLRACWVRAVRRDKKVHPAQQGRHSEDPGYCSTEDPSGKGHTQGQGIPHLGWACSTLYGRICQSALGHLLPDVKLPGTSRYQRGQTSLRLEYCK